MHIHILGIAGTFMAGLALLARALGHRVTGSDAECYPPMSTLLKEQAIEYKLGYQPTDLTPRPDLVIVGNAMSRGRSIIEVMLNQEIPYISGPQWLAEHVLHQHHVVAIAGTHGKTTTASMLTWILEVAKLNPSFLIGGVPGNFPGSARLNPDSRYFVIEADEYDSAFFDKRSKFLHYRPQTLVINNVEFDHIDIFNNLEEIKKQFHYLVRTVPGNGAIIYPEQDENILDILEKGCWSTRIPLATAEGWQAQLIEADGSAFSIKHLGQTVGFVQWSVFGLHNVQNALAAIAAADNIGIDPHLAAEALHTFVPTARRLQKLATVNTISVYDDFAHHPTAIKTTLRGLRAHLKNQRILVILECRSHTMRSGVHRDQLAAALADADEIYILDPVTTAWNIQTVKDQCTQPCFILASAAAILEQLKLRLLPHDHVVIMSNGGFDKIHQKLLTQLTSANY